MADDKDISKDSTLFYQIILTFHTAAWQQMGKVVNPLTNKVEKDLRGACFSIDMLDMLKNKTKGNLEKEEAEFLDRVLSELKLNYLEELKKQESEPPSAKADENEPQEEKDSESDDEKSALE